MSPEAEEQAFRRLLVDEASKDRSPLQLLGRPVPVAVQAIALARVQIGRAKREIPGAIEAGDFDEPYLSTYRSLVSGCNALLAAYSYRVRGGEGSHFETLRLAALGLAASSPKAGTLLETIREPIRSARNEAEYQRPGVTTAADLREILDAVPVISPLWWRWSGGAPAIHCQALKTGRFQTCLIRASEGRVYRFAFESQDAEDAFMDPIQGFSGHEPGQRLHPEGKLAQR